FKAVDALMRAFTVNELEMKVPVLETAARAPSTPDSLKALVTTALAVTDDAIAADNFVAVSSALKVADSAALRLRVAATQNAVRARIKEVDLLQKEFERYKQALTTLEKTPDDAEANLTAGRYLLFSKRDWDKALSLLAKSSDAKLKELAQADLAK